MWIYLGPSLHLTKYPGCLWLNYSRKYFQLYNATHITLLIHQVRVSSREQSCNEISSKMAPYNPNYYDSYEDDAQKTVDVVTRIVHQAAQAVTFPTNGIIATDDFGSVNSAIDAISGNGGDSILNTAFGIPTTEIIREIADSNSVDGATTEIIEQITNGNSFEQATTKIIQDITNGNSFEQATTEVIQDITNSNGIVETTDFPTHFEKVTNHYFSFAEVDLKDHDGDSLSNNMPYIILVVVLAVLVAVTVIALVVYQRRKSAAITDKNQKEVGVVGTAFNKTDDKREAQTPQQIMYGEH
ncbi:uncharacterized protein LOC143911980 [Arctopsyche grandis]|uniref:uncharacterized protein LOC143911980 n=1 Tax=Arctopsyche grandis TaxID=121162 RepID=UPI00406D8230